MSLILSILSHKQKNNYLVAHAVPKNKTWWTHSLHTM